MDKIPIQIVDILKKYKEILKKDLEIRKLILFGSYAKGNFSTDSDIDICIIADNIGNNYLATLKAMEKIIEIDLRLEPVVFSSYDYDNNYHFGLLKEVKQSGVEI
jgi:predicted nucleotidyltransferase